MDEGQEPQPGKSETCVYLKAEQFVWKEFEGGSQLLKESGPRYGLGIFHHASRNGLTFRPMAEVYGGKVDYDGATQGGTPIETDTNYLGGKLVFDAGRELFPASSSSLEAFVGLGLDYWVRDIESTSVGIGYEERWTSWSARGGVRGETRAGGVRVFGEAMLQWPFSNENRVDFPFVGEVKVRPKGELGWSAEAGVMTGPVRIAFYYGMVNFSKSDEAVIPIGGGMAILLWQPDSEYSVYGATAGWLF